MWDNHRLAHLRSLTSKRCGTIVYCSTTIRPGFCPFCIGDTALQASNRLSHWSRDGKLSKHIENHIQKISWPRKCPRKCPHPQCKVEFTEKLTFQYHLIDMHSLKLRPIRDQEPQTPNSKDYFIDSDPENVTHERTREISQDANREISPTPEPLVEIQTICPRLLSKVDGSDDGIIDLGQTIGIEPLLYSNMKTFSSQNELEDLMLSQYTTSKTYSKMMHCSRHSSDRLLHLILPLRIIKMVPYHRKLH